MYAWHLFCSKIVVVNLISIIIGEVVSIFLFWKVIRLNCLQSFYQIIFRSLIWLADHIWCLLTYFGTIIECFRMGWAWRVCLSEGICRVFLFKGEVGCTCWQMQGFPISNLHGCEQRRELDIQCPPNFCECCDMGSLPCKGDHPTNCCGSCQLYGVEGWGIWNLVKGMGFLVPRGWSIQKTAWRGQLSSWTFSYVYDTTTCRSAPTTYTQIHVTRIHFCNIDNMISFFILQVQSSYYLVSLVDNDYVHGDLFAVFTDF